MKAVYETEGRVAVLELNGEWSEVCNAVRQRLFPGTEIPKQDEKFDALIWARNQPRQKAA